MSSRRTRPYSSSVRTANTAHERFSEWVLLNGDRSTVAGAITALSFAFFAALVIPGTIPLQDVQSLFLAYSALVTGNVTLVTVVVSINQLLLSRELQTPGELRSQIDDVIEYRRDVEEATGEIAPVEPLGFLELLLEATREEAQRLGGLARDERGHFRGDAIEEEVDRLTEQMDRIDALLEETEEDTIDVLSVLLETNYAREINRLRRLKDRDDQPTDDAMAASIDALIDRLQEIDVARQYFKTIYLQQELSSLSRILLYVGLPAVVTALASLLLLTLAPDDPGALPRPAVFLPVTLAVATLPLAVLCSYTLRMATVTNLTSATLPFTTPEQER